MNIILVAKIIGIAAFIVSCIGYLQKQDNNLRIAMAIAAGMFSFHYFLMLAWVPAVNLLINAIRNNAARKLKGIKWFILFAIIQLSISITLYSSLRDLLPISASLVSAYAMFCSQKYRFRLLILLCSGIWLINNIVYMSYGPILQEIVSISMNIIGINRIRTQDIKIEEES